MVCGTVDEIRAYLFGERMIQLQRGMIRRTDRVIAELSKARAADQAFALVQAGTRQATDYCHRNRVMSEHRDILLALAERSRAVVQ